MIYLAGNESMQVWCLPCLQPASVQIPSSAHGFLALPGVTPEHKTRNSFWALLDMTQKSKPKQLHIKPLCNLNFKNIFSDQKHQKSMCLSCMKTLGKHTTGFKINNIK